MSADSRGAGLRASPPVQRRRRELRTRAVVVSAGTSETASRASYFSSVYATRYWSAQGQMAGVPPSGPGSSVAAAANVRVALEGLSREFDLELIIDAPCGDMTWMPRVDLGRAAYVGADIVPAVVAANRAAHADRSFLPLDIADASSSAILRDIVGDRGNAALVLARHLLFHLPASDGRAVLQNVEASGARWLLTSTFVRADDAMDEYVLANGHRTNLLRPPYVRRAGSSDASRRRRGGDVDIPWE